MDKFLDVDKGVGRRLVAVGAGPWIHRSVAASQAGLVVGLGVLLGAVAGFAPAAGLLALRPDLGWQVPWWGLVATVIGAPLATVAGTVVVTRSDPDLVRRRD